MTFPSTHVVELLLVKAGITLAIIAIVALAAGCSSSSDDHDQAAFAQSPTRARPAPGRRPRNRADYTFAKRAEFTAEMKGEIAALTQDIEKLSAKVEKGGDAAKAEAKPKLQALRDQLAALNADLDRVPGATASTWDEVKAGCAKGYASLTDGVQAARQWVNDKL